MMGMLNLLLLLLLPILSRPFVVSITSPRRTAALLYSRKDSEKDDMLDEFTWRAAQLRLEEANTQRMIKRKPIKLPYLDARRWVQANLGASDENEFNDMVANGNLRTPYIPKSPKKYYSETGDWISWDHFLTGFFDEQVPPSTGRFD